MDSIGGCCINSGTISAGKFPLWGHCYLGITVVLITEIMIIKEMSIWGSLLGKGRH